jgi:cbb3-type cytochrome oxidase subunit 3
MIDLLRGAMTVILLMFFIAIVVWAWSGRRKAVFDSMARMALDEDSQPTPTLPTVRDVHHE